MSDKNGIKFSNRRVGRAVFMCLVCAFLGACSPDGAERVLDQFPTLELSLGDSVVRLPDELPSGGWKGMILVKFDTDCHLCHDKAASMEKERDVLEPFMIVMVSSQPFEKVESFAKQYGWSSQSNILYGSVSEELFYETFQVVGSPTTLLFDKTGKEVYRFDGNPSLKPILPAFFKE
ncbi:redoxin domain-containing protein [Cryomorphaceae bacterium]|nr:redoxin domain-containing protein [Cryomorphaceae bacterium]